MVHRARSETRGLGRDSTHYLHSCRRHHNRAVTGLWLASLHDGKRGTCQVSQAACCLGRHQPLLDIRNSARAFATLSAAEPAPSPPPVLAVAPLPTPRPELTAEPVPSSRSEIDSGGIDNTG